MPVTSAQPSVKFYDLHPPLDDFQTEVIRGLSQPQKSISPQFLYDKRGSELFDQICTLPEYYLTRTEIAILQANAAQIAELMQEATLIEFGSGSSQKVRVLLDAAPSPAYVALDISKQHLYESCLNLAQYYPQVETIAICTDYTQPLQLPEIDALRHRRKVGFFPGSSIGNLEPQAAVDFLKNVATVLQPDGGLLIGVDLKKSKAILEPAYDDAAGVSAAFALNLLTRINRELSANFDLDAFRYQAFYNPIGRIEMGIVSTQAQTVQIGETEVKFQPQEVCRTEYSYKYGVEEFQDLAEQAGFTSQQVWVDPHNLFSVHYLTVIRPQPR